MYVHCELGSGVFRRPRTNCGIGACGVAFVSRNSSYRPIDLKPCAKDAGTVPASFWLIDNPTRATPELRDAHATPHAPRKRGHGRRRSYPPALPAQPQAPSDCPLASGAVALAPQHHPASRRATGCASVRFSPARSSRKRAIPKTPENSWPELCRYYTCNSHVCWNYRGACAMCTFGWGT